MLGRNALRQLTRWPRTYVWQTFASTGIAAVAAMLAATIINEIRFIFVSLAGSPPEQNYLQGGSPVQQQHFQPRSTAAIPCGAASHGGNGTAGVSHEIQQQLNKCRCADVSGAALSRSPDREGADKRAFLLRRKAYAEAPKLI